MLNHMSCLRQIRLSEKSASSGKHLISIFTICILALLVMSNADAQVPNKISYQGLLTTSLGAPVQDGIYDLRFDIYNLPTVGILRFTETHNAIPVLKGVFNVILHPTSEIFVESLFLEVTVLEGPNISSPITFLPRSELSSVPYAFRSDTALHATNVVCAGSTSGIIDTDFQSFDPNISVTITNNAFKSLLASEVVATACAYVITGGSPQNIPMTVAAKPYVSGTLRIELILDPLQCAQYIGKTVKFNYILSKINN